MKPEISAIPTVYKGIRFRSRLEATWAAFFDNVGWKWEYEPLDLEGYIPDFLIWFDKKKVLVEVKPAICIEELEEHHAKSMEAVRGRFPVLFLGSMMFGKSKACIAEGFDILGQITECECSFCGLTVPGQYGSECPMSCGGAVGFSVRECLIGFCWECNIISFVAEDTNGVSVSFCCNGIAYGGATTELAALDCCHRKEDLIQHWASAKNSAQWRGRS